MLSSRGNDSGRTDYPGIRNSGGTVADTRGAHHQETMCRSRLRRSELHNAGYLVSELALNSLYNKGSSNNEAARRRMDVVV